MNRGLFIVVASAWRKLRGQVIAAAIVLLSGSVLAQQSGLDPAAILKPLSDAWPSYSGDYTGRRYSALRQINTSNVKNLTLAWTARLNAGPNGAGSGVSAPYSPRAPRTIIGGVGAPILGAKPENGPATAFVRPDGFNVSIGEGAGIGARVRNVLLAGPDARIDCILDSGDALEVRLSHEDAEKLAPKDRVTLSPRAVRVWNGTERIA